jgi:cell division GTPase FtsZ
VADATFDGLLDWIQRQVGRRVTMEVGAYSDDGVDTVVVTLLVAIIGIEPATNRDAPDSMAVLVRLGGERSGLYLEHGRVSRVVVRQGAAKVWLSDGVYVALAA